MERRFVPLKGCFAVATLVITRDGPVPIRDLVAIEAEFLSTSGDPCGGRRRAEMGEDAGHRRPTRPQSTPTSAPHLGHVVGGSTGTNRPQSGHTRGAQHAGSPPRSGFGGAGSDSDSASSQSCRMSPVWTVGSRPRRESGPELNCQARSSNSRLTAAVSQRR